ncbi:MAG: chorismate synthase [Lawsonella sp.]
MFRWSTAGESHGQALIAFIEGAIADVPITSAEISRQLARRRLGYGRGARMKFEQDKVTMVGGVRHGRTLGSPIAIEIANTEWPKWEQIMSPDPVDQDELEGLARNKPLTRPRPGHADYSGMMKYRAKDARNILERSSARETAARVAAGTVARSILRELFGVEVISRVISIGASELSEDTTLPTAADIDRIDESPVRASDKAAEASMVAEIDAARKAGDTLGGVIEVIVHGLPVGLGSHVTGDSRIDARIAGAVMSIQAIKGVEIGDGFDVARKRGSQAHDEIYRTGDSLSRETNHAGGVEGGMTDGQPLIVRAAMKPISTVPRALSTVDLDDGSAATAIHQRSDVCAVPAAAVVMESVVALVLAQAALEKFGGDTLTETKENVSHYLDYLRERQTWVD